MFGRHCVVEGKQHGSKRRVPGRMQPVLENVVRVGALVASMAHASLRTQSQRRSDGSKGVCQPPEHADVHTVHHCNLQLDDLVVGFDYWPTFFMAGHAMPV